MYYIEGNYVEVLAKLGQALGLAADIATGPDPEVDALMRRGIDSHFNVLSNGGGSDPLALQGTGTTWVRWFAGRRHPFTTLTHYKMGVDPRTILISSGRMREDFTKSAIVSGHRTARGSKATLYGGTSESIRKAQANLQGGPRAVNFPFITKKRVMVNLPRRQFVYWDTIMRDKVIGVAQNAAQRGWSM